MPTNVFSDELTKKANILSDSYKKINSVVGIAIGGSVARNFTDNFSDVELYIYYKKNMPSISQIKNIIKNHNAQLTRSNKIHWQNDAWGYHTFIQYDNTKFEIGYRNIDTTIQRIKKYLLGYNILTKHGIYDVPFGHYESGLLSCIRDCIILFDKEDFLNELKELVSIFPDILYKKILDYYFKDAEGILKSKLKSSIERNDTLLFNSCASRIIRSITICLFTINREYYIGDKWNEEYIKRFTTKPEFYNTFYDSFFTTSELDIDNKEIKYKQLELVIDWLKLFIDNEFKRNT